MSTTTATATLPQATPPSIPIVAIGKTRATALQLSSIFAAKSTPYYLAAVLDMTESPKEYRFSDQNLGAVLWTLNPRLRAVVCGTAIGEDLLMGIERVWNEYAKDILRKEREGAEGKQGGVVAVSATSSTA